MKRLISLLMLLALCLTACGAPAGGTRSAGNPDGTAPYSPSPILAEPAPAEAESPACTPDPAGTGQPEFMAVPEAEPEEPYSIDFSDAPFSTITESIPFTIRNHTGKDAQILLIPALERQTASGGWETVPFKCKIGFCGTPDPLPPEGKTWSLAVNSLYGLLPEGTYRLTYTATDSYGAEHPASGLFLVQNELCGYPPMD